MKNIQEGDLLFDVTLAISAEKFDDNALHGNKSTIKRVDIIIENRDQIIFLEVKDPDIPGAVNPDNFKQKLVSGSLIPDLASKYRDTWFFTSLRKKHEKPIAYVVLICMGILDDALLLAKTDALKGAIPIAHKDWPQDSLRSCVILKLDAYRKVYGEESVWRESDYR